MREMFCFQCQQTAHNTGCDGKAGVCGKKADTANYQDELIGALIGLARAARAGTPTPHTDELILKGLFTTITNVNFNNETILQCKAEIEKEKAAVGPGQLDDYDLAALWAAGEDVRSLKSLILFGLKGMAAYAYHARALGRTDPAVNAFFYEALEAIGAEKTPDELLALVLKTGEVNLACMALLDAANTGAYGDPVPVTVPLTIEKGPFIVVSGHDLHDLKLLLDQTAGRGINIYTHSEMLPAHGYPELKRRYPHLKGNFGTAWQNQQREFEDIPAPVLFTTNCIMPLRPSYADRVFTTSVVSYPGIVHIGESRDFSPVIAKALELGGYEKDTLVPGMNGGSTVATGFARDAVLHHAGDRCGREKRADPPFLPGGRLRRHPPQPPLLHRVCQAHPAGHRAADPGLRQVPPERPAPWHRAGHRPAPHPGRGPVQRRLQRHPDRAGAGGRLWLLGQRTAPLHHPVLV